MTGWRLRPLDPATDRPGIERLWRAALAPAWPLLPDAADLLDAGLVAEADRRIVGLAAIHPKGSLRLIMVDPAHQRRGIGSALHAAALQSLRDAGATEVAAGSGAAEHIWPGVPTDLPAAAPFFTRHGWAGGDRETIDLTLDLRGYLPPPGTYDRPELTDVEIVTARDRETAEAARAFDARYFPSWSWWFTLATENAESPDRILAARHRRTGEILGTLLYAGPDAPCVFRALLGPANGTIGCVGVAPHLHGRGVGSALVARASELLRDAGTRVCHIGWTAREAFYARLGYRTWRRYRMFRKTIRPASRP
jgi:beta-N-acetylhexosaminidase